ncbi:MAG: transcription termination/antitermination NusG family protein [Anaerolineaceae bacterium]|nr:transcription termination/antitermination NusG family protein [Anaerolineaceae bacterium]
MVSVNWYVLHSKPRKEEILFQQVQSRGIDCLLPRIKVKPVNPKARKTQPYFPGYMFVRVNLDEIGISTFQWMPFSTGLVAFDGIAATVPDALIKEICYRLEDPDLNGDQIIKRIKPGDEILIKSGIFAGYEAIFDFNLPGRERVRVFLKLLNQNRNLSVELPSDQIKLKSNTDKK